MVAAWIRAETGVGPSMASGSQTYSGTWADLPVAPMNRHRDIRLRTPNVVSGARRLERSVHFRVADSAEHGEQAEQSDQETPVADPVDDERFLARVARRLLEEVEADQKVRAQAHAFPAHEHQRIVVRQHQREHEEDEEVEVAEEPVVAALVRHVAGGIDMDQESDAGHHQDHEGTERVEQEAEVRLGQRQPGEQNDFVDALVLRQVAQLQDSAHRQNEGDEESSRRR